MRPALAGLCLSLVIASSATLKSQVPTPGADSNRVVNLRIAQPSPQMIHKAQTMDARLQPAAKIWIVEQARTEAQNPAPDVDVLNALIRQHLVRSAPSWPGISNAPETSPQYDVDALAFMVMMQATQDNEDDLISQMASLQAINREKGAEQRLLEDLNSELAKGPGRDLSCTSPVCRSLSNRIASINETNSGLRRPSRFEVSPTMSYQQVANLQLQLSQNLESMNEVNDMTTLRLQMTMDRRSKFIQALSNIGKKISSTSSAIVQNFK